MCDGKWKKTQTDVMRNGVIKIKLIKTFYFWQTLPVVVTVL